jgi:hypothetical protein
MRPIDADGSMSAEEVIGGVSMHAVKARAMAAASAARVERGTRMSMTPGNTEFGSAARLAWHPPRML